MNLVFLELPDATFELFTFLLKELPAGWTVSIPEKTVTQPASGPPSSSLQDLFNWLDLEHINTAARGSWTQPSCHREMTAVHRAPPHLLALSLLCPIFQGVP